MTQKDQITKAMTWLAEQEDTVFLGEGLINAGRIYGTLNGVSMNKCIEFPIAENLIMGAAIGLAIRGFRPIVIFQRMDFMLCAADAIINHLCKIPEMSGHKIKLPVIIRAIIGNQDKSFDVGIQHKADYTHIFEPYLLTRESTDYQKYYYGCQEEPVLLIERFNRHEETI